MSRIKSPGGAGRRVKAGTKEYKGNLKKIEDRRDTGMTIAVHRGRIEDSKKAIKKHTALLKKLEGKKKAVPLPSAKPKAKMVPLPSARKKYPKR